MKDVEASEPICAKPCNTHIKEPSKQQSPQKIADKEILTSDSEDEDAFEDAQDVSDKKNAESSIGLIENCPDHKCVTLTQGQRVEVTISNIVNLSKFYVQLADSQSILDELADSMFEHYSDLEEGCGLIDHLQINQLCASQSGDDDFWYRAQVINISTVANTCELFFVDYGNSAIVAQSSVRELLPTFQALEWQCVACSLGGIHCLGDSWSQDAIDAFEELVTDR